MCCADPFTFLDELNDDLLVANNVTVGNCNSLASNSQMSGSQVDILQRNQHLSQLLSANSTAPTPPSSIQTQIQPMAGPKLSNVAFSINNVNLTSNIGDNSTAVTVSLNNVNYANFAQQRSALVGNATSVASVGGMARTQLMPNVTQNGMTNVAIAHSLSNGLVQTLGQQQHAANQGMVQNYMNRPGVNMQQFVGGNAPPNYATNGVVLTHNGSLSGHSLPQQQHILHVQVSL